MLSQHYFNPINKAEIDLAHKVRPFIEAPPTKLDVPMIDLQAIDLSTFLDGPHGLKSRQQLANQLESALTTYGFFKLTGHGIDHDTLERMKSIGQSLFELEDDTKKKFHAGNTKHPDEADRELGVMRGVGYKPRGHWEYQNGQRDNVEFFNIRHFLHDDIFFNKTEYPEFFKYYLDEVSGY